MQPMQESDNLFLMVGEIRSDVKKLLENNTAQDKRLGALERKFWTSTSAIALIATAAMTGAAKALGFLH